MKRSYTEKFNTTRNVRYFDFLPGNFKLPRDRSLPNFCISWIKKFWQWQGIRCHFASIDFKQICHPIQQGNFFWLHLMSWKAKRLSRGLICYHGQSWSTWSGRPRPIHELDERVALRRALLWSPPRSSSFWAREVMAKRTSRLFSQTGRRRRPLIQKSLSG